VSVEIVGRVRGRVATGALVRFAVATADGADVWTLRSDRWLP
jgi:hypothetical protein